MGHQVVAAQLDLVDAAQRQHVASLAASGALDLSAARILLLGRAQVLPQNSVLWLQLKRATTDSAAAWLQQSPQLVVLAAGQLQVREPTHMAGMSRVGMVWLVQQQERTHLGLSKVRAAACGWRGEVFCVADRRTGRVQTTQCTLGPVFYQEPFCKVPIQSKLCCFHFN
jgi:hypothetical protein